MPKNYIRMLERGRVRAKCVENRIAYMQCDVLGDILQKFLSKCIFKPTTLETLRSALYTHIYYAFITE